jgi:osmotically inducible lipoprotein OsmB
MREPRLQSGQNPARISPHQAAREDRWRIAARQPCPPFFVHLEDRIWELLMSRISYLAVCAALALATAACGETPGERALTGGAIGAGGGALVGAATGNVAAGAIVGGLGGAAIGAATTPRRDYYY